jgi:hypothetical protein
VSLAATAAPMAPDTRRCAGDAKVLAEDRAGPTAVTCVQREWPRRIRCSSQLPGSSVLICPRTPDDEHTGGPSPWQALTDAPTTA